MKILRIKFMSFIMINSWTQVIGDLNLRFNDANTMLSLDKHLRQEITKLIL